MTEPAPVAPRHSRLGTFFRILNVRLRFMVLMVVVGLVAGHWDDIMNHIDRWRRPAPAPAHAAEEVEYYCPMHPNIVRAQPGQCPICGMPLARRAKSAAVELPEGVLSRVQLTPQKMQMGRIATTPVGYQLLSRAIRTVGIVDYDETSRAQISARIKGRIDRLIVNYVGQHVEKGDPLALLYSPDLLVAQRELIEAVKSLKSHPSPGNGALTGGQTLVDGARRKLSLWGITDQQIDDIIARGTPETHLTIFSPISGIVTEKYVLEGAYVNEGDNLYTIADLTRVWMQAKVFDDQVAGLTVGQAVEVTAPAYASEIFAGRIAFIAYTVDPATRTVAARVDVANPDYKLRPGMYVTATIRLPVGQVTVIPPPSSAPASTAAPANPAAQKEVDALARAYLSLTGAFAQDKTDDGAARELTRAARALADESKDARGLATTVAELAGPLVGQDLKDQRAALAKLSENVIALLRSHPPNQTGLLVAHCPMVDADWLQTGELVSNPYYGSKMLRCGSITGPLVPASTSAADEHVATGYFCPIYPDRLYDQPMECPLDKFPLKYVKIEKTLAVPAESVIDTGTRKVVYRESETGTFDMVAVRLGRRAGEFYPLLGGLDAGDRIASAGAFLVDAENRLNPAAAAQYFGASGNRPSDQEQP